MKKVLRKKFRKDNEAKGSTMVGFFKKPIWQRKYFIAIGVFLLVASAVGTLLILNQTDDKKASEEPKTFLEKKVDSILAVQPPADHNGKVDYYADLAQTYAQIGDYKSALKYSLEADKYITDHSLNGQSVNLAIADNYEQTGNKKKAKEYYQKEIDRIQSDPENVDTVNSLKEMINSL